MGPVPPFNSIEPDSDLLRKTLSYRPRGDPGHDRELGNIFGHDGTRANRCAISNGNTGKNSGAVADPNIMADDNLVKPAPGEKVAVIVTKTILVAAIGKVMQRRPFKGVIARIDSYMRRDGAKFTDLCVNDLAVIHHIGVIPKAAFSD